MEQNMPKSVVHTEFYKQFKYCPVCKENFSMEGFVPNTRNKKYSENQKKITRDHILPKVRITLDLRVLMNGKKDGVKNHKAMCAECNSERGFVKYDHCIAALVLDRLVKGDMRFYNENK